MADKHDTPLQQLGAEALEAFKKDNLSTYNREAMALVMLAAQVERIADALSARTDKREAAK